MVTAEATPDKVDLWDHRSLMDRWEACIWGRQIYNIKCFGLAPVSLGVLAMPDTGLCWYFFSQDRVSMCAHGRSAARPPAR